MNKKISTIDLSLVVIPVVLVAVSVSLIYSLLMGTNSSGLGLKQGLIGLAGLIIMTIISFLDYRFYKGSAWILYAVAILLLITVDLFGKTVNGARNWIDLGFFPLQPSEVTKVSLILLLSSFFCEKIGKITWKDIFLSFLILMVPVFLILKEPDFGTALVIFFLYFSILFLSRPTLKQVLVIVSGLAFTVTLAFLAYFNVKPFGKLVKDYQRQRIAVFVNPENDPYGRGYNVKQARITIGSGGIFGKGLGKGSQSQLQFLPEAHTDFIFAGVAESFGYLGAFVILVMYFFLIMKIIDIGVLSRDNFGMLSCFGIVAMILFQIFVNVGMNLGLAPVAGIPLPMLSYGGTSLLITLFSLGIVQSVYMRHRKLSFSN